MSVMFVYVTAKDADEARAIAKGVVGERLAACANVMDGMESFYWWDDVVQTEKEAVLILKTTENRVDALTARVKELHSYDCPCVVALPVSKGNDEFLTWVGSQVQ